MVPTNSQSCKKKSLSLQVLVNFLLFTVFTEKSAENSLSSDPENLLWHSSVFATLTLTRSSVSTLSLCLELASYTRSRVDFCRLLDNKTIFYKLTDVLS